MKTLQLSIIVMSGIVMISSTNFVFAQTADFVEPKPVKDWLATHPNFSGCVQENLSTGEYKEIPCSEPGVIHAGLYVPDWIVKQVIGKFLGSNPPKPDQAFNFQYRILNGTLESLTKDSGGQFIAKVKSIRHRMFELKIPRNYPLSNMPHDTTNSLGISVNGVDMYQPNYSFAATDCFVEYSIPFSGSSNIRLSPISYPESVPLQGASVPDYCKSETMTLHSPLKQFKSGAGISDIVCNKGLYLVVKSHDQEPICLKAGAISKLASRGLLYATNSSNPRHTTIIIPPGSENQASHNTYSPDSVTVVLGVNNTVRWVNQAETANTIVPDMPLIQNGIPFGSDGVVKPRQSYQFTFTEPGTFAYHTEPHPWMKGSVTVLVPSLKMEITGLNQSYKVNHTIVATVKYAGYEQGGVYPDVKILDTNGTQVWSNCCIAHTETTKYFGTFTYDVEGLLGHPVINKTGTYTMVATLDNVTTSAIFNVMPANIVLQ